MESMELGRKKGVSRGLQGRSRTRGLKRTERLVDSPELTEEKMITRMTPRMMRRVPWISFFVTAVETEKRVVSTRAKDASRKNRG